MPRRSNYKFLKSYPTNLAVESKRGTTFLLTRPAGSKSNKTLLFIPKSGRAPIVKKPIFRRK